MFTDKLYRATKFTTSLEQFTKRHMEKLLFV